MGDSLRSALDMALELIDLRRNGTSLGDEFPESRARIAAAADLAQCVVKKCDGECWQSGNCSGACKRA